MASTRRLAGLRQLSQPYSRCPGLRDHIKSEWGRREWQPGDTLVWLMSILTNNQVLVRQDSGFQARGNSETLSGHV